MLLIFFLALVAYFICAGILRTFQTIPKTLEVILTKIRDKLEWSGLLRIWLSSYYEIMFAATLQLRVMNFKSPRNAISSLLGAVVFIGNLFFPILIYLLVKKYGTEEGNLQANKNSQKFSTLFEGCKSTHPLCKYIYAVMIFRRLLQSMLIVFCYYDPLLQTTLVLLLVGISTLIFVKFKPYTDARNNFIEGFSEACFFIIHLVIRYLAADDSSPEFSGIDRINMGWVMICCCCLVILIELGIFIKEYADMIHGLYKRYLARLKGLAGKGKVGKEQVRIAQVRKDQVRKPHVRKIKRIKKERVLYPLKKDGQTNILKIQIGNEFNY